MNASKLWWREPVTQARVSATVPLTRREIGAQLALFYNRVPTLWILITEKIQIMPRCKLLEKCFSG